MTEYHLKPGPIGQKVVDAYENVEKKFTDAFLEPEEEGGYRLKTGRTGEAVTGAYKKLENGVVSGYQKVEDGVVGTYKKIENAFVDAFLEKDEAPDDDTNGEAKA